MALSITHAFVSAIVDSGDASLVEPSDWNAAHTITGFGTGIETFLQTPSSANLASAITDETGSGALVFGTAPTLASTVTIGTVGGTTGTILLKGTTSGTVTIKPKDAAGTYTLVLPDTDGGPSEFLQTDGSGNLTWAAGGGTITGTDTHVTFFDGANNPAGDAGLTYNKTANTLTLTAANAASSPSIYATGTWFTGGTATTTKPQLLIEATGATSTAWSTEGTGLGINSASGYTGYLIDAQLNGASAFSVNSAQITLGINTVLTANKYQTDGFGAFALGLASGTYGVMIGDGAILGFTNSAAHNSTTDIILIRDAANTLAQRRTTNAQIFRIYDTFASSTDFHRLAIATARATLSNVSGATVTATSLIPDGAVVVGVTTKVTTALGATGGTTGYQVGDGTDPDRWGEATTITLGTVTDNTNWTATTIQAFTSASNVVITAVGGNFDATGVIYVSVQYLIGQAD